MPFTGFYVCPDCKPEAVRKLSAGLPVGSLWKNGTTLVALRDVTFPNRCVKCNAPMDSERMYSQTLNWHHPLWYLLLLGTPIYLHGDWGPLLTS
jgi:hypothetical protein